MVVRIQTLWSLIREVNVGELRETINQPFQIAVLGSSLEEAQILAELIAKSDGVLSQTTHRPRVGPLASPYPAADVYVVAAAPEGPTAGERNALQGLIVGPTPVVLVFAGHGLDRAGGVTRSPDPSPAAVLDVDLDRPEQARRQLASALFGALAAQALTAARQYGGVRDGIADRLIRDTSFANAQFALFSTLPNWLPLGGFIAGAVAGTSADLLVLTKNQAILVLKLAGIYGRDLSDWRGILIEIAPVVGGAFLWRTVARSLVGLLPGPAAAAPKTAVAFVGTMTVGEVARRYYRDGGRVDRQTIKDIQERAVSAFLAAKGSLISPLRSRVANSA